MPTREEFLNQVRRALGHEPGGGGVKPAGLPGSTEGLAGVMPPLPPEQWLTKFEAEWSKVGGVVHQVSTRQDLEVTLKSILNAVGATSVVLSRNPLLASLRLPEWLRSIGVATAAWPGAEVTATDEATFRQQSFAAAAGITGVTFVLAESGSLVLTSVTEGAQLASLAPPVHIALYQRNQLVGSLDEVLAKLSCSDAPSPLAAGRSIVFISGTSRTADIEQILIRGVHGPREVHAILVEDSCL